MTCFFPLAYENVQGKVKKSEHSKGLFTAQKIRRKLWIWSHLLKKCLMENFIFCAVVHMK